MPSRLKYKISSDRRKLYPTKDRALDAAAKACLRLGEPQVLMGIRADGAVRHWEVVSTERLYFEFNQKRGALVTLVDTEWD